LPHPQPTNNPAPNPPEHQGPKTVASGQVIKFD